MSNFQEEGPIHAKYSTRLCELVVPQLLILRPSMSEKKQIYKNLEQKKLGYVLNYISYR